MPVQQHPIPQNVTQYQFRLVGDMTLKQFLQLAAGAVLAVISYSLPIPILFKWPLVVFFAGLGAALAFLPVQGRPLSQWIIAFFKSIYSPTIYTWKKTKPSQPKTKSESKPKAKPKPKTTQKAQPTPPQPTTKAKLTTDSPPPKPPKTPQPASISLKDKRLPQSSPPQPQTKPEPKPKSSQAQTPLDASPVGSDKYPTGAPGYPTGATNSKSIPPSSSTPFSSNLPIPHPPQEPNTIVGMTLTPQGKILENTLIEILKNNITARATKSNKLGQFRFIKPLQNGQYQITAEHDQYSFSSYNLKIEGKILPPIKLQAGKKLKNQ